MSDRDVEILKGLFSDDSGKPLVDHDVLTTLKALFTDAYVKFWWAVICQKNAEGTFWKDIQKFDGPQTMGTYVSAVMGTNTLGPEMHLQKNRTTAQRIPIYMYRRAFPCSDAPTHPKLPIAI